MLPEGWKIKNLEELVSKTRKITYGIVVPGPNTPNGNLMIRAQDYSFGWKDIDTIYRVTDEIHDSYKRSQVKEGDVLLTIVGSIGKTAVVPKHLSGANLTQQTARLSFCDNDPSYFHAVLSSPIGKREVYRFAKSGVQPSLNLADICKFKIPVPPLPEQKKIAQILSTWDNAISATERLLENSQQRKKSLMQQLLTGKKRLPGFEGEWKIVEFSDAFTVANQKACQVKATDYKSSGTLPIVDQGKTLVSAYTNSNTPYTDLPVIIFGDHTRVFKWVDFIFCPGADGTQVLKAKSLLDPKFSYFTISNIELPNLGYSRHMRELKERDFKIPLDIGEQQAIANVLTTADQEIDALQKRLDHLKLEKKALMQQLLTGKRRVQLEDAA